MAFSLFGPAFPFGDLFTDQCVALGEAARELAAELAELGDHDKVPPHAIRIRELERHVHTNFRRVGKELALTQIRPLERADVHELNLAFEGTSKAIAAVAARASMYGFRAPRPAAQSLAATLVEMIGSIARMLEHLDRLESVAAETGEVERAGGEAEGFLLVALGELYEDEQAARQDPLEVLRWTHLYERLQVAIERAQNISTILEAVVLKCT
jgi:uncharacterized protein